MIFHARGSVIVSILACEASGVGANPILSTTSYLLSARIVPSQGTELGAIPSSSTK